MEEFDWVETHVESMIDLRECSRGDLLISRHGAILVYMGPTKPNDYMDHTVEYIHIPYGARLQPQTMGSGTRTHDGYVFKKNRLEEDHDVVKIVKKDTEEHKEIIHSACHILCNYLITISMDV
jgi:hypothetical protein